MRRYEDRAENFRCCETPTQNSNVFIATCKHNIGEFSERVTSHVEELKGRVTIQPVKVQAVDQLEVVAYIKVLQRQGFELSSYSERDGVFRYETHCFRRPDFPFHLVLWTYTTVRDVEA